MKTLVLMLCACVFLCFGADARAALFRRVPPFTGQISEGFEDLPFPTDFSNLADGLASFAGVDGTSLTVQDGNFASYWDQHAFEGQYFLGGTAGSGRQGTIEITFDYPVRGFGGSFGHRVHPLFDTTQDEEFVFYDAQNRVIGRDKVTVGRLPGSETVHWQFMRRVKRLTITAVGPMADALTFRLDPAIYRRFLRDTMRKNGGGSTKLQAFEGQS